MSSVWVVIPAFNEEKEIVQTIRSIKQLDGISHIMVVNDGSTDQTSVLAKAEGVEVLDLYPNRGKGGAMNAAIPHIEGDIIVFLDADLGDSAAEAVKIIAPVKEKQCDICIAAFPPPRRKGGFGLVKGTAAWAIHRMGGMEARAPLSGQRAMTREVMESVTPFREAFGVELGMTLRALAQGFKVKEVLTMMRHHETGRDLKGFRHRGRQWLDVLKVLWQETRRKKR